MYGNNKQPVVTRLSLGFHGFPSVAYIDLKSNIFSSHLHIRLWKAICNTGRRCVPNCTSCIPHVKLGVCKGKPTFSGFSQIVMGNRVETNGNQTTNGNCVSIGFHGFPSRGNRPIACRDNDTGSSDPFRLAICGHEQI
jgi:hypothetical protein